MTASSESERRRRFEPGDAKYGMTPPKATVLWYVAQCGFLTTSQVARIAGITRKSAYNHLRDLFDHGLSDRLAVPYADLAPPDKPDPGVSWAPGENVHYVTKAGVKWLADAGHLPEEAIIRPPSIPARGLFLAHEVLVRDVRVWLEMCSRAHGGAVTYWVDGEDAHFSVVRPDAWFLYKLPSGRTLVGLVEADRKTERGGRWAAKAAGYTSLLGSDELAAKTGGRRYARVVAVTLDSARRDRIIADVEASPAGESTFCAAITDLTEGGLNKAVWRHRGSAELVSLVPVSSLEVPPNK